MFAELLVPAVRSALRRPGFSLVVIVIVALSAGLATTAGNLAYQTLFRPLPYAQSDRLFVLSSTNPPEGWWEAPGSVAEFKRYQHDARLDDQLAVFFDQGSVSFVSDAPSAGAELVPASYVEHTFFPLLGIAPAQGRTFSEEETRAGTTHPVVVVSHRFWQTKLGGRADVVGTPLRLADRSYEIIGVMPAGYRDVSLESGDPQLWFPLPFAATQLGAELYTNYTLRRCRALLKLTDGATRTAAQGEADEIGRTIDRERPADTLGRGFLVQPLRHYFFWRVEKPITALFAGALLVLGIAAVNLTNLFLVQGLRRAQELAVRSALGADARRVGLTVLADALVPLAAGAVLAVTVAFGLSALLRSASVLVLPEFVSLDLSPVALTASVTALVVMVVATTLGPVLRARRIDLRAALQSGNKGGAAASSARSRNLLIAAEVALAALLLVGTGLTAKSLWEMMRRPVGFRPENMLTLTVRLDRGQLPTPADRAAFTRRLHEAVQGAPGASAATLWSGSMLGRGGWVTNLTPGHLDAQDPKNAKTFQRLGPAPGALAMAGVQLLRGRDFSPSATPDQPAEIIIDEKLGRALWPDEDPLGKTAFISLNPNRRAVVVGVVAPVRNRGRTYDETTATGDAYFSPFQQPMDQVNLLLRVASGMDAVALAFVREQVARLDPNLAIDDVRSMPARMEEEERTPRFTTTILATYAGISLLLTLVGVYGVLTFSVAQRYREFGVRLALGAQRSQVTAMVLRQSAAWIAGGLAFGLTGAALLAPQLGDLLIGVSPHDPVVLGAVATLILTAGLLAAFVPAWRAARADPMMALRAE
ncbi:MAG: hypothetical protein C0518_03210 [Opitutus sp.]|nr:hypothetical protein [Opitutus sp.]